MILFIFAIIALGFMLSLPQPEGLLALLVIAIGLGMHFA